MRILVAPLDWGLGHASRCVPLIQELIRQGAVVTLASAGPALKLLRRYFPDLPAEELPAYDIRYPSRNMVWNLAWQTPHLAKTIRKERQAIQSLVGRHDVKAIISDNRFGCYHPLVRNIFITHQLTIRAPKLGNLLPLKGVVNRLNHYFIRQFDECWVPDVPGPDNLSGALSAGRPGVPVHFVGWLSQMRAIQGPPRYLCVAVLSGPEPQRSRLEAILRPQLQALEQPSLLVRGIVRENGKEVERDHLQVISYLHGRALNEAMSAAQLIIARSGYSTLMDLAMLGKKALLIPTPGQTEQLYLAQRLAARGRCWSQNQDQVKVAEALAHLERIKALESNSSESLLQERVRIFLER